jgi:hypothetical protein
MIPPSGRELVELALRSRQNVLAIASGGRRIAYLMLPNMLLIELIAAQ